jgi:uncharacterized protein with HEPN domain
MPRRSREAYLWDIADSCKATLEYVRGSDLSDYEHNRMLRRAVERELSIIGEAVSQATRHFPELETSLQHTLDTPESSLLDFSSVSGVKLTVYNHSLS